MPFERATNRALGELLVERGFLTAEQCELALDYARRHGKRIGEALTELGLISHGLLSAALGEQFGMRPMVIEPSMLDFELLRRFPLDLLRRHKLLPLIDLGDELIVAVGDPNDREGIESLSALVPDRRLVFQLADAVEILRCLAHPQVGANGRELPRDAGSSSAALCHESQKAKTLLFDLLRHQDVAAITVRVGRDIGSRCWIESRDGSSSPCTELAQSMSADCVYEFFRSEVQWCSHFEGKAGFWELPLEKGMPQRVAVVAVRDLHGLSVRFRLLCPLPGDVPLTDTETCRDSLVFLLYDSPIALAAAVQGFLRMAQLPFPVLVVTEHLPWLFSGSLQFPAVGPELLFAARAARASQVVFDSPIPVSLLHEFLAASPSLSRIVVAVEPQQWKKFTQTMFFELEKGVAVGIYRLSADGAALEELPNLNDEATEW
ncbi:MAG: hypothetical protein ACP5QZ_04915 [Candidatus Sumerlaeaceae bacterium]|jgi:hypothetical protein